MRGLYTLAVAVFVSLIGASIVIAEPKVEEQIVAPAWEQGTTYTLSPRGLHLAAVAMKGSRWAVTVDGVEGPKFDAILNSAFEIEPARYEIGMLLPPRVKWEGPVAFSPDGSRYAYAAREGDKAVVILDGKEIWRGDFTEAARPRYMAFTPDGKHLYFFTRTIQNAVIIATDAVSQFTGTDVGQQVGGSVVFDGQAGPVTLGEPLMFFSPDGSRWGYRGIKPETQEPFLVIDG